jgi:hypothetical protein
MAPGGLSALSARSPGGEVPGQSAPHLGAYPRALLARRRQFGITPMDAGLMIPALAPALAECRMACIASVNLYPQASMTIRCW